MLAKAFACWFIVLILVPFTAPFSTCDFSSAMRHHRGQTAPGKTADGDSLTDAAVVPARMMGGRDKLVVLSTSYLAHNRPRQAAGRPSVVHAGAAIHERHALLTILRL